MDSRDFWWGFWDLARHAGPALSQGGEKYFQNFCAHTCIYLDSCNYFSRTKNFLKNYILHFWGIFLKKIFKKIITIKMGENLTKNLKNDRVGKIILEICDSIQITKRVEIIIQFEKAIIKPDENQSRNQNFEEVQGSENQ